MAGIGVFILWLGYSVAYYGVDQIRSGNNGLLDLMLPSRRSKIDTGANAPDGTPAATTPTKSGPTPDQRLAQQKPAPTSPNRLKGYRAHPA